MTTRSRPSSALSLLHLLFISIMVMPAVSSICIFAPDSTSIAMFISSQSRLSSLPVLRLCMSTLDSMESSLCPSCSLDISRLNIMTEALPLTAAFSASERAKAVLPMAGLAASIIRSDFCSPEVIVSRYLNPVVIPVRPPSICEALSIISMLEISTSLIWAYCPF